MKHRQPRRTIAALAAAISLSQTATGQQATSDLSGPWRFQTASFDGDCTMMGAIKFQRAAQAGSYTCTMIVETQCRNKDDGLYEYWRVNETCTAKQTGERVQITGKIEHVEDAIMFGEKLSAEDRATYVADNFNLTIRPGAAEMNGQLLDRIRRVAARVWREVELVS